MVHYRMAALVACRVLALYLLATWIFMVVVPFGELLTQTFFRESFFRGSFFRGSFFSESFLRTLTTLLLSVLVLIPPLLLWCFAPFLSRIVVGKARADAEEGSPVTFEAIQVTAFAVLGIYLVFLHLPHLVRNVFYYYQLFQTSSLADLTRSMIQQAVTSVLRIGLGLWLFLGAGGFVKAMKWAREAGTGETGC